ncbi:MAG: dockerin type I domain-containing protein [Pirellulaceae bacterium]|nr:dockerin type I domain-containing protein [Pirellulaceae bacterium]
MSQRYPRVHRPARAAKRRLVGKPTFGRRPNFERLECRNLLTGGMEFADVELLTMAALFEDSPAPDEVAYALEESSVTSDPAVPTLMLFSAAKEDWQDADYEQGFALTAFGGEMLDGEMLDGEVLDGEVEVVDQPLRMRFSVADADITAEIAPVEESESLSLVKEDDIATEETYVTFTALGEEDGNATEETYVTFMALGGEGLDEKVDVVDEPVLMRYSATSTEDVQAMGGLAEVDPSAEIMLYAAMGPSPWQNLDNPDDVNVDGSTTPFDALLVINRINEGISLSAVATSETTYLVDVNGDRSLDATDAIQVINTLNTGGGEALVGDDVASRVAPLWYDGGWNDDSAWQETDTTEPSDGVEGDAKLETEDAPLAVARLGQRDEALDADSLDQEKPKAEVDDGLFSEDTDWLLADVI